MNKTIEEYLRVIEKCKELFLNKHQDYGTSWRIMRLSSITDQLYIKAKRIRTLEIQRVSKVGEGVVDEYIGIVNYSIIALIQMNLKSDAPIELSKEEVSTYYQDMVDKTLELLKAKNHDYGEAWRDLRITSMTDLILTKIHRVKQIEDNQGKTIVSEGLDANYQDMLNYAVFALIKLGYAL